jgi:hypothetical protein
VQGQSDLLRLFWHFIRAAASRTFCTAGNSNPMRIAMIAITTSSSMSVNPASARPAGRRERRTRNDMDDLTGERERRGKNLSDYNQILMSCDSNRGILLAAA